MTVHISLSRHFWKAAAASVLWLMPWLASTGSEAQPASQGSASGVYYSRQEQAARPAPGRNRGVQNRAGPKRRSGKEGSAEAKMDAEQAREIYLRRKVRLEQIRLQQNELSKDKLTLASKRARMQARLVETARALRLSEKRLTEIEEKLAQTGAKMKEEREKLEDKTAQMSAVLALMQGMSRQPPPLLITHSRDALKMIRSGMILATFYGDIEKLAAQLSEEVNSLEAAQKEAALQEQRRKAEQIHGGRLKEQIGALLRENREQLETNAAALARLKTVREINTASLRSLEEMLPVLDAEAGKQAATAADAGSRQLETSPGDAKVAMLQPGRLKPSIPFANAQGLLPLPVQGRILTRFGEDIDGTPSKGVHLETRPGAQVISPCDGQILYAGPFRSYGQLLIISPGGGYHVVIAGMDRIQAQQGQSVLAGEPVAVMGNEPRNGEETPKRPTLYVEFRRDQQSIDPEPWWSAGGRG